MYGISLRLQDLIANGKGDSYMFTSQLNSAQRISALKSLAADEFDILIIAGGHEYSPTREKLENSLKSSITHILAISVAIEELA